MRKKEGITLIALVVTIIVLLILAGIVISLILGENGLLNKANIAKKETSQAKQNEIEDLDKLDKYIQDNINEDGQSKTESTEIDKSHDGIQYAPVTTDDGMWTIYKDIDTETRKVNVYVTSKYYCPSFEQFVLEKMYLNTFLYSYSLPIYSFSDLSDFYSGWMMLMVDYDIVEQLEEDEYIKQRKEQMGIGPFLSEVLEKMGVDEYELFNQVGAMYVRMLKGEETLDVPENMSLLTNYLPDYMGYMGAEINYNNLWISYNKLYGEKVKQIIPEEVKSKTYKIQMPDGHIEEIKGEQLYKAKFRYVTTKNGDIQIKIEDNMGTEEMVRYSGVNNIGSCVYEKGSYFYSYNCLPILDQGSYAFITEKDSASIKDEYHKFNYDYNACLNFRFALDRL